MYDHTAAIAAFTKLASNETLSLQLARKLRDKVEDSRFDHALCWSETDGYFPSFDRYGLPVYELLKCPATDHAISLSYECLASNIRDSAKFQVDVLTGKVVP